ncbi:MAG: hypothetical protein Kow0031_41520 [Anaerolineae bacterium]
MNRLQILASAGISALFSLAMVAAVVWGFAPAQAAPLPQTGGSGVQAISVPAMAFNPVQQNSSYALDSQRQLLWLMGTNRSVTRDRNIFVAPLLLPDRAQLLTLVVAGEDYDTQGEVRVRLKRCDQRQPVCVGLGETTSQVSFAGGYFETPASFLQNEVINNASYTYFLELELTALNNSGLRSVRLDAVGAGSATPPVSSVVRWELGGAFTSFPVPTTGWAEVKICTDDLSYLPNASHYPFVVVDGVQRGLSTGSCLTVQGYDIEIRRNLNTGPSSGTYQILR